MKLAFSKEEIQKMDKGAFSDAIIGVYSCNSATRGRDGRNFAKDLSEKSGGTVFGWESGKTDYAGIYNVKNEDGLTMFDKLRVALKIKKRSDSNLFEKQIRPADNLPKAGATNPPKITYQNGKEIKREESTNNE